MLSPKPQTNYSHGHCTAIPSWEQGFEFSHLISPGGLLCASGH